MIVEATIGVEVDVEEWASFTELREEIAEELEIDQGHIASAVPVALTEQGCKDTQIMQGNLDVDKDDQDALNV